MVWQLGLCASTAGGPVLNPGWGAKIPYPTYCVAWTKKNENGIILLRFRLLSIFEPLVPSYCKVGVVVIIPQA